MENFFIISSLSCLMKRLFRKTTTNRRTQGLGMINGYRIRGNVENLSSILGCKHEPPLLASSFIQQERRGWGKGFFI